MLIRGYFQDRFLGDVKYLKAMVKKPTLPNRYTFYQRPSNERTGTINDAKGKVRSAQGFSATS